MSTLNINTAQELINAGDVGPCELIKGELIMMSPAGANHGDITNELAYHLTHHVKQADVGCVFAAETGFLLSRDPDTVRAPDVAFVSKHRLGDGQLSGYFQGAPDIAAEVVSPHDRKADVDAKVNDWLTAGCLLVWVVNVRAKTIRVNTANGKVAELSESESLNGGDVLPGFSMPVRNLFD